jgi:hypothetical protein
MLKYQIMCIINSQKTSLYVFGLQELHAVQQLYYVSQVILLVNINSLKCKLLTTSKPW